MSDFQVTQEKIHALLEELRSWSVGEVRHNPKDLAKTFGLDVFVVEKILRSEGIQVQNENPEEADPASDPNASTLTLDVDDITQALSHPEANPDQHPDEDTGVWRKKPTGEWELVNKGRKGD